MMHAWVVILSLSAIAQQAPALEGKIAKVQYDFVPRNWLTGYQGDALFVEGRMVYSLAYTRIGRPGAPFARYPPAWLYAGMTIRYFEARYELPRNQFQRIEILEDPLEDLQFDAAVSEFIVGQIPQDRLATALRPHTAHLTAQLNSDCGHCREAAFASILDLGDTKATLVAAWCKRSGIAEVRSAGERIIARLVYAKVPNLVMGEEGESRLRQEDPKP
jgi:hypothetical protein